ncbi:hypothetical protein [Rubrivirga marina]|uniref:Uncharacterized protein n=1 Tax=Rubrivirga marina TaxID=1196024 RepID=A0A271J4L0_9BACT|nr:hypothetical protein [Rubrivirga marina]PAP78456.1 hypothetical protein BSZ37_19510 [Rubrivirga marina]
MVPAPLPFRLAPRRAVANLLFGMIWAEVLVVVLDVWLHLGGGVASPDLAGWFDAASERGVGSWLSVTQTVLLALTLWAVVAVVRQSGAARARVVGWVVLAAFMSYLALDDGTRLHERVGAAFEDSAASKRGIGAAFPSYYWQLVLGPAFAGMGLFMAVFLWREFRESGLWKYVGGAFALLATAVALDFVDGLADGHPLDLYGQLGSLAAVEARAAAWFELPGPAAVLHLSRIVEESLEMAAMTLLWVAFLTHLTRLAPGVLLTWAPEEPARSRVLRADLAPELKPGEAEPSARPKPAAV